MDQLWAPWRLAYVTNPKPKAAGEGDGCFICRGLAGTDDRSNLIAFRTELAVVVLNRFPYNNGHLLIAPKAHKPRPDDLTTAETLEVQDTISRIVPQLHLGAAVTTFKNIVDKVVTEYGVAELRGSSIAERTRRLIAIAHPSFRDQLATDARQLGYLS